MSGGRTGGAENPRPKTVAFDIETLGLEKDKVPVTCVGIYGSDTRGREYSRVWNFIDGGDYEARKQEVATCLNEAERIIAFNGVQFDIPFLQIQWGIEPKLVREWVLKSFDPYETCEAALNCTFGLQMLLTKNGKQSKTASGKQAIVFALNKQTKELEDYCLADARLTYQVCDTHSIKLPIYSWATSYVRRFVSENQKVSLLTNEPRFLFN